MKINWGTGIIIAFVCFIGFIMYFVISMMTNKKFDHDLVTEEYYKQELNYQEEINALIKVNTLEVKPYLVKTQEGIKIIFSDTIYASKIKGTVSLYRPSNKLLDYEFPISISNNYLLIPENRLLDGRWDIKVFWEFKGEAYLFKESVVY